MAQDSARAWGQNQFNASGEAWLSNITDNARARMNFSVDRKGRLSGDADVLLPLIDTPRALFFTQLGVRSMAVSGDKDRWIANVGLGQRWFLNATKEDSGNLMFGINAFIDHDITRAHNRGGAGVELQYDGVRVSSNLYAPLSRWKNSPDFDHYEERPARGWDVRVEAALPFYRPVTLTGGYTRWYGDEVDVFGRGTLSTLKKDPKIWDVGVKYTPFSLFSAYVTQRNMEGGHRDTVAGVSITYHLDQPWHQQIKRTPVNGPATVDEFRYDLVNRENRMPLAYQKKEEEEVAPPGPLSPLDLLDMEFTDNSNHERSFGYRASDRTPADLPNNNWVMAEIKISPKSTNPVVRQAVQEAIDNGKVIWTVEDPNITLNPNIPLNSILYNGVEATGYNGLRWTSGGTAPRPVSSQQSNQTAMPDSPPAPIGAIAQLTDIIGSRTLTVKATIKKEDITPNPTDDVVFSLPVSFGAGPLSMLRIPDGEMQTRRWASGGTVAASSSLPAADLCGGKYPDNFRGWKPGDYSVATDLPSYPELLAVSVFAGGMGAAQVAGWPNVSYWSGQLDFLVGGTYSHSLVTSLDIGGGNYSGSVYAFLRYVVCRQNESA